MLQKSSLTVITGKQVKAKFEGIGLPKFSIKYLKCTVKYHHQQKLNKKVSLLK